MISPIRKVLSWFSRQFKSKAKTLSAAVQELLAQGASARDAVNQAWSELGFSQFLNRSVQQSVQASFHKNAPPLLKAPTGAGDPSGMTLSQKLHGTSAEMRRKIIDTIQVQQKLNRHAIQTARALYDGYNAGHVVRKQAMPKYLDRIVEFARRSDMTTAEYDALLRKVRKAQRIVDGLGQHGAPNQALKSAYNELLRAVVRRSDEALERAVKTACEEKSRYVAERIARTESARAWADGFVERYVADDSVVAYKWRLASRHPEYDICNLYAEADLWGLGPGVYPKDKTPDLPVHPHCLCHLAPVYASELKGKKPIDRVEKAGRAWIARQTLGHQQALLGVRGQKLFSRGAGWRSQARGYSPKHLGERKLANASAAKSAIIKARVEKVYSKFERLNYPPKPVDVETLEFDSEHANTERQHNITEQEAKDMVSKAVISMTRWQGRCEIYCSIAGWVYVLDDKLIRTAFRSAEFDEGARRVMEVLKDEQGLLPDNQQGN